MDRDKTILHSDLNGFYASVEIMLDPSLKGKDVAVCGSTEDRHGIVLAKSESAKKAGIKTGMVNWEAKQICPNLIIIPPKYSQYLKYSKLTRKIYMRYTDKIEPFGMDECWLDVTESAGIFGDGESIAQKIRKSVKEELGLTVSIGVSFNKVFAKLGSDMKKPDAVTVIRRSDFKEKVWPLPAGELLYVGRSTRKKLARYGILTIGDISFAGAEFMNRTLGKNGVRLWIYASGNDLSRVTESNWVSPIKTIGHGITCSADLYDSEQVWKVILELSQDVGHRLRVNELCAGGVQLTIKDKELSCKQYQAQLLVQTQSAMEIGKKAMELFEKNYMWETNVRAVTVRAINLTEDFQPAQLYVFDDIEKRRKREKLEETMETIRERYGKNAIKSAVLMGDIKIPDSKIHEVTLPGMMHE
ncbi:DNA polymerase Y family protein [Alkalibacter mobilis]|uniref:DNA polymerase Y family protein n=1 Tax=Alkalibacter mobilis TaxID=2787712 RepID=UPI00189CC1D9|nr:DNA polymerase IV [Alkalibacter mobilis]MBF7097443.1 DNA polymerase IV [Alkalibacter mobilis]